VVLGGHQRRRGRARGALDVVGRRWFTLFVCVVAGVVVALAFNARQPDRFASSVLIYANPSILGLSASVDAPEAGLGPALVQSFNDDVAFVKSQPVEAQARASEPGAMDHLVRIETHPDDSSHVIRLTAVADSKDAATPIANAMALAALDVRRSDRAAAILSALDEVQKRVDVIDQRLAVLDPSSTTSTTTTTTTIPASDAPPPTDTTAPPDTTSTTAPDTTTSTEPLTAGEQVELAFLQGRRQQLESMNDSIHAAADLVDSQEVEIVQTASDVTQLHNSPVRAGVLGGLAGLVIGLAAVALLETTDRRVRGRWLEGLGVTWVALPATLDRDLDTDPGEAGDALDATLAELGHRGARSVGVASCARGAGRSTVVVWLAELTRRKGLRPVAVSADCGQRSDASLHRVLGVQRRPGLTELLALDVDLDGAVHLGTHDLAVIPAGGEATAPSVASDAWAQMPSIVNGLTGSFDLVLVDLPAPLTGSIDGRALVSAIDVAVVVVDERHDRTPAVRTLIDLLQRTTNESPIVLLRKAS
jgi:Mrp family chromosome partitioning ATPase